MLSLLYGPTLSSLNDYWKNRRFDCMGPLSAKCCLCFLLCYYAVWVCHSFPSKEQGSFNSVAAVTVHSDFDTQENTICHYFPLFPIYLPWSDGTGCRDFSFFEFEFSASFITLLFYSHQRALYFLFSFCHSSGIIFLSEVVDISPSFIPAFDSSSLAFHMMYSA